MTNSIISRKLKQLMHTAFHTMKTAHSDIPTSGVHIGNSIFEVALDPMDIYQTM